MCAEGRTKTEWDSEKRSRLDALHATELGGTLDQSGEAELKTLLELVEAEEREWLSPGLDEQQLRNGEELLSEI